MKPVSALSASESWLLYTRSLMCNLAVLAMDCLTRWRNIVSRHDVIWLSVLMFPQCHNTELSWNVLGYKYNPCSLRGNEPLHLTAILQTCLLHLTSDNLRLMTHCMGTPFICMSTLKSSSTVANIDWRICTCASGTGHTGGIPTMS